MRILDKSTAFRTPATIGAGSAIAIGLVIALTGAIVLDRTESLVGLWHVADAAPDSGLSGAERRQAVALTEMKASVDALRSEVVALKARAEARHPDASQTNPGATRGNSNPALMNSDPGIGPDGDLAALRSSIDDATERTRHALIAANKRIDWLETLVYSSDVTGSVPAPPAPSSNPLRHGVRSSPAWVVLHAETGLAVIAGREGPIDVTPGFVVPGLGAIKAIRQEGDRWVVETEKGTIRAR
jgi:hypothetical protein